MPAFSDKVIKVMEPVGSIDPATHMVGPAKLLFPAKNAQGQSQSGAGYGISLEGSSKYVTELVKSQRRLVRESTHIRWRVTQYSDTNNQDDTTTVWMAPPPT